MAPESHKNRIKLMLVNINEGHALRHNYLTGILKNWKEIPFKLKNELLETLCQKLTGESDQHDVQLLRNWKKVIEDSLYICQNTINLLGKLLHELPEKSKEFHDLIDLTTRMVDAKFSLEKKLIEIKQQLGEL